MEGRQRREDSGVLILLTLGWLVLAGAMSAWANDQPANQGHAEAGRSLFNGKGACYYCHGVDGYRDKVPQLEADTSALIAQLNPPPPDLRTKKGLKLKTDKARAKVIREGHEGTGMFPDTTLSDQEIADTVAYLAVLRREGQQKPRDGRMH